MQLSACKVADHEPNLISKVDSASNYGHTLAIIREYREDIYYECTKDGQEAPLDRAPLDRISLDRAFLGAVRIPDRNEAWQNRNH
jgi:hypothetical protein